MQAGDPEVISRTVEELRATHDIERANAVDDLAAAGSAAREHVRAIIDAAPTLAHADRWELVPLTLARIGGESAAEEIARELASPDYDVATVLDACFILRREAAPAAPLLAELAREYPFRETRVRAAAAYEEATGQDIEPGPGECPKSVTKTGPVVTAQVKERTVELISIPDARTPTAAGRCSPWIGADAATVGFEWGEDCLLGFNKGEFGGWVEVRSLRNGSRAPVMAGNPLWFINDRRGAVVLDGLAHLSYAGGSVHRLRRLAEGRWLHEPIARLEGVPIAYGQAGADLLVMTQGDHPGCANSEFVLVSIDAKGRVAALD